MEMLRFITAGSVDDGKSTLIGRLLYDSKSLLQDQIEAAERASTKSGLEQVNLALITDGLKAEREQGITIDVAYKYFQTPKRKFIIADAPGHVQYTRNMVTGASTANLIIILIDARKGVIEQTYRHSYIASMMRIPHMVVCINKMDLVGYSAEVFERIRDEFLNFSGRLGIQDITFIPISALSGDNVVDHSKNMPWYDGRSLLHHLEDVHVESDVNLSEARFPVQYVIRPNTDEYHDFRGFAGQIASGIFKKGDEVTVLPSGFKSRIKSIWTFDGELDEAYAPMSVSLILEHDIDAGRGSIIVPADQHPTVSQSFEAYVCWMDTSSAAPGKKMLLQHTTNRQRCIIEEIVYKVDINTFEKAGQQADLNLNDIARVKIRTAAPISYDEYKKNRALGGFILIDEATNMTSAAGTIVG